MKKTIIFITIMFAAISSGFPQGSGDIIVDHVVYEVISIDDMTLRAIGLDTFNVAHVAIPYSLEYNGRSFHVTEVDLKSNTGIMKTLILEEGLLFLSIGSSMLKELNIPSTVTTIGKICSTWPFDYLRIPSSVISIQKINAFRIKYLNIEDGSSILQLNSSDSSGTFSDVPIDTLYLGRTCWCESWGTFTYAQYDCSFHNCHIQDIRIGNGVRIMPRFSNSDISQIVIPGCIEMMNKCTFDGCNNLETIIIEDCTYPLSLVEDNSINIYDQTIIYNENLKNLYIGRNCNKLILGVLPLEQLTFGPAVTDYENFYTSDNTATIDVYGDSCYVKVCQLFPPEISLTFSTRTFLDTPLLVPLGTKELYQHAEVWKNFFIINEFEWEDPKCCIFLSTNDDTMGTTSGQNLYRIGESAIVKAIPNEGYVFVNWTENDSIVSTDSSYSFIAESNRSLVANFTEEIPDGSFVVTASSNPLDGGIIIGTGVYQGGTSVIVKAIPNSGYRFIKWMEEDAIVSSNAEYSFIIQENRNLVAHFSGLGVNDYALAVKCFPNPTNGIIKIEEIEIERVEAYNVIGQLVKESKENVIDLSAQEAGTYILKVITPSGVVTKQIVKN